MYYINCFFIYSILGYLLETAISLITKNGFKSGVLSLPWTPIYGIGALIILFTSSYLFKNLHMNRVIETIIVLFVVSIVLSFFEALAGVLTEKIFGVVFWDYENQKYNIGHYISLEITLVWFVASLIFIYVIHPLLKNLIKKIPVWLTVILIILFLYDSIKTFISKKS